MIKIITQRSEAMDVAKGILISTVVVGHSIQFIGYFGRSDFWSDPIFKTIYMFHMPLFMAYAGYFSPTHPIGHKDIIQRARSLIYPMIPWAVIMAVLRTINTGNISDLPMLSLEGFIGMYWFLWATFLSFILLWIGQLLGNFSPIFYSITITLLMITPDQWDVFPKLCFVFPFFLAGHAIRRHSKLIDLFTPTVALLTTIVAAVSFWAWTDITYIYNNDAHILEFPTEIAIMFIGAACATALAAWTIFYFSTHLLRNTAGKWIAQLGRITLEVYLVQGVFFAASGIVASMIISTGGGSLPSRICASVIVGLVLTATIYAFVNISKRSSKASLLLWGR